MLSHQSSPSPPYSAVCPALLRACIANVSRHKHSTAAMPALIMSPYALSLGAALTVRLLGYRSIGTKKNKMWSQTKCGPTQGPSEFVCMKHENKMQPPQSRADITRRRSIPGYTGRLRRVFSMQQKDTDLATKLLSMPLQVHRADYDCLCARPVTQRHGNKKIYRSLQTCRTPDPHMPALCPANIQRTHRNKKCTHSLSSPHLTRYFTQSDAEHANVDAGHGRWHLHASQQSLFGSKYRRIWRISSTGMNFPMFARVEGTCVIVCHIPDNMCLQWSTAFLMRPPPNTAVNFTIPSKYCCEFHNTYSAIVLVQAAPRRMLNGRQNQ